MRHDNPALLRDCYLVARTLELAAKWCAEHPDVAWLLSGMAADARACVVGSPLVEDVVAMGRAADNDIVERMCADALARAQVN